MFLFLFLLSLMLRLFFSIIVVVGGGEVKESSLSPVDFLFVTFIAMRAALLL